MADKKKTDKADKAQEPSGTFGELKAMVTDYAKQQTVEPLKNLGQWAGFGVAGAVCLTIGGFLTSLGILRLLQQMSFLTKMTDGVEEDTFWTFVPYMIVCALLLAVAGLCFFAMSKTPEWMEDDA